MIKKYIKGNEKRGTEVIKALEELDGVNQYNHKGIRTNYFYYIDSKGIIDLVQITSDFARIMQEFFEEIELPKQPNIVVKEPKQIYWFRTTKDDTKNQALFDKLYELVDINKRDVKFDDGIVYFNPLKNSTMFYPKQYVNSSVECTIVMMIGKELVIEQ